MSPEAGLRWLLRWLFRADAAALLITHLEFRRAGQSSVARIALSRTSIPRRELSEIENPEPAALVLAFRDEAGRECP